MALAFFRKAEVMAPPDIEAASLRSDRFRLERETDWRRLEHIVEALEKNRLRRISDDDLLALPVLYRQAASSLAVARETSLDAATLGYLESLVRRAWFQVYGPRTSLAGWLRRFLGGGWSAAVREIWLELCIALATMIAGTAVGWLLVARDSDWYYALVPGQFADARRPGASHEVLAETLTGQPDGDGLTLLATYLFSNNAGVAILAFALGFAFGVPTLLLLVYNMVGLGAMMWVFVRGRARLGVRRLALGPRHHRAARHPARRRGRTARRPLDGLSRSPLGARRRVRQRPARLAGHGRRGADAGRRRAARRVRPAAGDRPVGTRRDRRRDAAVLAQSYFLLLRRGSAEAAR